jgi:hypothetical protein
VLYRLSYALTLSLGMIREAGCRVPKWIPRDHAAARAV